MKESETAALRCQVLVTLAYVALCQGNPLEGLSHSRAVLEHPDCATSLKFVGLIDYLSLLCRFYAHLYAAEALLLLNQFDTALTHLSPENVAKFAASSEAQSMEAVRAVD